MKSEGDLASPDSSDLPPLLNLPDAALTLLWQGLRSSSAANALLQTCSQLRRQICRCCIGHACVALRGLAGVKHTVRQHAQGWPRLAELKSITFTVQAAHKARKSRTRRHGTYDASDDEELDDSDASDDDDDDEPSDTSSDDESGGEDEDEEVEFEFAALGRHLSGPLRLSAIQRVVINSRLLVHHSDLYALAAYCPALRQLELGSFERGGGLLVSDDDGHVLQPLAHMAQLTSLSLVTPANLYTDESIAAFASSLQSLPPSLTDVRLKWSLELTEGNVEEILHASRAVPALKLLDVRWEVGSEVEGGQAYFSALPEMQGLEDLTWLEDRGQGDREQPVPCLGPLAVASLLQCTRLRHLCLDLMVEGAEAVRLLGLPQLEVLQVHMLVCPEGQAVQRERALELVVSAEDLQPILQLPLHVLRRLRVDGRDAADGHSSLRLATAEDARRLLQLSPLLSLVPARGWHSGEEREESLHVMLPLELQLPPGFLATMVKVPGVQFHVAD